MNERRHVHACLKQESVADYEQVRAAVAEYLDITCTFLTRGLVDLSGHALLATHVECVEVTEFNGEGSDEVESDRVSSSNARLFVHVFKLSNESPAEETADGDESVTTCQHMSLPAASFHGLWDSLIFDSSVKQTVLDYAMTALLFSDTKVNPHIISWNRVVLLHGPPGTGKTSLCKALAQKLSIRLSSRYPNAILVEINAHSLFSKWFSESGKLFQQIQELAEDEKSLVCVLIDEVESLTAARKSAVSGSEPSDAIRVVNALLTQLDSLKRHSNVLILTTSNITEAIDAAFVDRADIKQYIGLPSCRARYEILRSCVEELQRVGIVQPSTQLVVQHQERMRRRATSRSGTGGEVISLKLWQAAEMANGFSGRALRRLPFQAHAYFVQARTPGVGEFIHCLVQAISRESEQTQQLSSE
uniref:AAA+ ATPase domain-containing protein n=1 Tax=Hyaloperonospora arabidopsidis (strain Emoy2) TaxID=559515 RepID=M4B697_HYAAE